MRYWTQFSLDVTTRSHVTNDKITFFKSIICFYKTYYYLGRILKLVIKQNKLLNLDKYQLKYWNSPTSPKYFPDHEKVLKDCSQKLITQPAWALKSWIFFWQNWNLLFSKSLSERALILCSVIMQTYVQLCIIKLIVKSRL